MAIGRIAGQMLYSNLERQGVDLAFDSNLIYLDVNNRRVGVLTTSPTDTLTIVGNVNATAYFGTNVTASGRLVVSGNSTFATNTTVTSTQVKVSATTSSTDYYTGAVVVAGGVGIDGNLNVRGYVNTSNLIVNGGNLTNVNIGNITFTNTTIGTTYSNTNIILDPTGTGYVVIASNLQSSTYQNGALVVEGGVGIDGNLNVRGVANVANLIVAGGTFTNVNLGNITISDTTISSITPNSSIFIEPAGTGLVHINTTTALVLPTGNIAQSPLLSPIGSIRYNTDTDSVEFFNGTSWIQTTPTVEAQIISPDGISYTYTLDRATTAGGVLVLLNGVMQRPGYAYSVSGNQITFGEVPQVTDIVDVRFISSGEVYTADIISSPPPKYINSVATTIDSFRASDYRTAKYIVQVSDTANIKYQSSEILVTHDGATTAILVYGTVYTSSNMAAFTATISSGTVNVQATSTGANCAVKIQKTYIAN